MVSHLTQRMSSLTNYSALKSDIVIDMNDDFLNSIFVKPLLDDKIDINEFRNNIDYYKTNKDLINSITDSRGNYPLHVLLTHPDVSLEIVQLYLVTFGADFTKTNEYGDYPLFSYTTNKFLDHNILEYMLDFHSKTVAKYSPEFYISNNMKYSLLVMICRNRSITDECLKVILEYGDDPRYVTSEDKTAMDYLKSNISSTYSQVLLLERY